MVEAMRRLFKVDFDRIGNQPALPDIFPRYDAPVVRLTASGERELIRNPPPRATVTRLRMRLTA